MVIHSAVTIFFFLKASKAYSEQVGVNLHDGGKRGEI